MNELLHLIVPVVGIVGYWKHKRALARLNRK